LIVAAAGVGVGVWQLRDTSSASSSTPTVRATRGELVVSVRARGKVVDARAASQGGLTGSGAATPGGATPAGGQGGQAASAATAGTSRPVFPPAAGRVTALLVAPGQHVEAGRALARLDTANARGALVAAQAALDQAKAQLEIDRSVTPQSLASAKAAVTTGVAALAAAKDALGNAVRVSRDAVAAARQQVAQAKQQLAVDRRRAGPNPPAKAAAEASVNTARESMTSVQAALADVRAVNAQQIAGAQHAVESAARELGVEQAKLEGDLAVERHFCGTTSPVITADTPPDCVNAAATVASDQQSLVKAQSAVQSVRDALAQAQATTAQGEHQAQAQLTVAADALKSARGQLAAIEKADGQTAAKDRQALAAARLALAQARSKAAESTSRAQVQVAAVGLSNARAAMAALELGAPAPLVAQDLSKIQAARAQVAAAASALAQMVVRAPSAGTVTWVFVAPGSAVDVATPIAAIADLAHLAVSLDLSEFDAARVRRGMSAFVSVDALGGKSFAGRVVFEAITGVDNGGVVTFPLRVALKKAPGTRIGMNVSARIVVARRRGVVKVPLEVVERDDQGRAFVTVVNTSGGTSTRLVSTGLATNKDVEVRRGLRAGERVVLPAQGP
jgi:multidrug efflux pump subunit AcrA (membrane-fusion protein)